MKCSDCKKYDDSWGTQKDKPFCWWHEAILSADLLEMDSAEKDCLGFECR